jgi:hypothetical protein
VKQRCPAALRNAGHSADDGLVANFLRSLSLRSPRRRLISSLAVTAVLGLAAAAAPAGAFVSGELGIQYRTPAKSVNLKKPLQYQGGPVISASNSYAIYWDPTGAYRNDWMTQIDRYFHDVGAASGDLGTVFSLNSQYTGPAGTRATYKTTWRGAYTDTQPYPVSGCIEAAELACVSDAQIRTELKRFVQANALPVGVNSVYYLLTPPGVTVCTDSGGSGNCSEATTAESEPPNGICGYHSAIDKSTASPIVYAVQPWIAGNAGKILQELPLETEEANSAALACQNGSGLDEPNQTGARSPFGDYETGLADVIVNELSIEQNNIVVDPLLNAWYQETTQAEQSDMCQRAFSPAPEVLPKVPNTTHALNLVNETINANHYYVQWAFSSVGVTSGKGAVCWQGTELDPRFTAPNPVNTGDIVAFDANESGMTLDANATKLNANEPFTVPIYKWNFGDHTPEVSGVSDASVFHSYQYGGTYNVTLTVTDSGGNHATVTNSITVVGESPPGSGGSGAAPLAGSVSGSATGTASPGATQLKLKPLVAAAAASRSLRSVLRHGLVVRYSVNEQVVGRFELMLAKSTARRLGLRGAPAVGLALGTPAQIIIGKAILVTTKGGRSTVTIQLSKNTASRLGRLKHVTLMVRLIAHNASGQSVTVLGTVNLSH